MYLFVNTQTAGPTPKYSLLSASFVLVDKKFQVIPIAGLRDGLHLRLKHKDYAVNGKWMRERGIDLLAHDTQAVPQDKAKKDFCDFLRQALDSISPAKMVLSGHGLRTFDEPFLRSQLLDDDGLWNVFFAGVQLDTASIARFLEAAGLIKLDKGGFHLQSLCESFVPHCVDPMFFSIELAKRFVEMVSHRKN